MVNKLSFKIEKPNSTTVHYPDWHRVDLVAKEIAPKDFSLIPPSSSPHQRRNKKKKKKKN